MIFCKTGCILCTILFLSACASPQPVYKPVNVEIPISLPCKAPAVPRPAWPTDSIRADAPMFDRVRALLQERELRAGYEGQLEAAVGACG